MALRTNIRPESKTLSMSYPPITSWTWHANLLSILTNHPCTNDWIYSNYVQLFCYYQGENLFVDFIPRFTAFTDCPWIYSQFFKRKTISNLCTGDIVGFFMDRIMEDNYIYGVFDESFFISRPTHSQGQKLLHELFIFGFDSNAKTFDVADFTFTPAYSYQKVSFEHIEKAYGNVDEKDDYFYENQGGLLFASFNNKARYSIDTELIQQTLKEYLACQNTTKASRMSITPISYADFGVNVYDKIVAHFQLLMEEKVPYDIRPLHVLYDHKKLMLMRIEYLMDNELLKVSHEFQSKYAEICQSSFALRNLFIKAGAAKSKGMVEKVICGIKDLKIKEKLLLEEMAEKLVIISSGNSEAHKLPY